MSPITLQTHSCQHCQKIVLDESSRPRKDGPGGDKEYLYPAFSVPEIVSAALDGCSFCTYLMDEKWIHRRSIVEQTSSWHDDIGRISNIAGSSRVIDLFTKGLICGDESTLPSSPANTLRRIIAEDEPHRLETLRLAIFLHDCEIKFFGLWDTDARHIAYRTRGGFSVFTEPGKSTEQLRQYATNNH